MSKNNSNQDSDQDSDDLIPPRRRSPSLVIIGVIVLIVIIVGGYFAIRSFSKGTSALIATPTPTLPPGVNLVSFVTNPAWGTIAIDGHSLTSIPRPGQLPLRLSTGVHEITWSAPPFPAQHCFLNVPPQSVSGSGTCNTTNSTVSATIVAFTAASTSLSQSQQASLTSALQAYARSLQASTPV